jgi:hypothetical protein
LLLTVTGLNSQTRIVNGIDDPNSISFNGRNMDEERPKRMALIASQGTLDWAYPPFILASTAVAMEMQVAVFFTFYGLTLLKRKITAKVAPHANPAMPMKMPFGPKFPEFRMADAQYVDGKPSGI